jgi:hypothetical protein
MKRRQKISAYIEEMFEPDSAPDPRTIVKAIEDGHIEGEFFLGRWWVLRDRMAENDTPSTGNEVADNILARSSC